MSEAITLRVRGNSLTASQRMSSAVGSTPAAVAGQRLSSAAVAPMEPQPILTKWCSTAAAGAGFLPTSFSAAAWASAMSLRFRATSCAWVGAGSKQTHDPTLSPGSRAAVLFTIPQPMSLRQGESSARIGLSPSPRQTGESATIFPVSASHTWKVPRASHCLRSIWERG